MSHDTLFMRATQLKVALFSSTVSVLNTGMPYMQYVGMHKHTSLLNQTLFYLDGLFSHPYKKLGSGLQDYKHTMHLQQLATI